MHCLKDCFTWVNHKTTGIPPAREYLQQRLEVEEGSRAWLPTLNIFSHFSRDEIGRLVEELCRTGLHFVAANQAELKNQKGWREVIFYFHPSGPSVVKTKLFCQSMKDAGDLYEAALRACPDVRRAMTIATLTSRGAARAEE